MTDLATQLTASILHAELPLGELLARLRRGNELIEQLSIRLDELTAQALRSDEIMAEQRREMAFLRAQVDLLEAKLKRRGAKIIRIGEIA